MKRIALALALTLTVAAAHAGEPASPAPSAALDAQVMMLGGETWEVREQGQSAILARGATETDSVLEALLHAYVHDPDPEVRFRARRIMETLVDRHLFSEKRGFLGVSLAQNPVPRMLDGKEVYPIVIQQVLPDHVAVRYGIQAGQEIAAVDGRYCDREKFNLQAMIGYISSKKPGTEISIDLLSGEERTTKVVPLGPRPVQPNDPPIEVQRKQFFKQWLDSHLPRPPES